MSGRPTGGSPATGGRRTVLVRRMAAFAALLVAVGECALAGSALQPPPGYFGAVGHTAGKSLPCGAVPAPFTGVLDFPSKYQGSGKSRDRLNPRADAQYKLRTRPITEMENGFSKLATRYMRSGDPAQLACAVGWLATWADARALEGDAHNHTGKSMRKWCLASLSGAYLRLKFSSSTPLKTYPKETARIEAWFGEVADRVKDEWPPDDPTARINNHYYWAAWSMMAAAVATDRRDLFDRAVVLYRVFCAQVDADGYLPNELARASRAAEYHSYALLPISMLAAFGKANGVDLASEGQHALRRFGQRVQVALENPDSITIKTGARQEPGASDKASAWAWLRPYCWAVNCSTALQLRLVSQRPTVVTRLGGDMAALFPEHTS